jgi:hypothetical protein
MLDRCLGRRIYLVIALKGYSLRSRESQRTVKVKIAAQVQPVLPPPAPGSPFTAVEFDGMTATPYVDASRCSGDGKNKCAARQAYSLKATGVRAPSRGIGRPVPEHKDAA